MQNRSQAGAFYPDFLSQYPFGQSLSHRTAACIPVTDE
jgi:hypothetical protein